MPTLWAPLTKRGKPSGSPKRAVGTCKGRSILIAPGGIIGVFGDGQEFDMGEAHVGIIGG